MDYQGFLAAVRSLNKSSYFYGNEVLYRMAAESDIKDPDQLAGTMWLIGRSYAASPQRRSYGTDKETNWPVRSDNDGRDQFFASIARHIVDNEDLSFLEELEESICFDNSDGDKAQLTTSIKAVLDFNAILSKAIQEFDFAPDDETCNDHISFCSKFLHFYFPNSVFIIDTYARNGGINLYNPSSVGYICSPERTDTYNALMMQKDSDYFISDLYKHFQRAEVTRLSAKIADGAELADKAEAKEYINHCVRSYLLGCKLKDTIEPNDGLAGKGLWSMPRLIDTVFLNIKGKLTKDEANRLLKTLRRYKDTPQSSDAYKKYFENAEYMNTLEEIANGTKLGT